MHDHVRDDEILYRRVPYDLQCFEQHDGVLRVTRHAFRDPNNQPSVDRSHLCNYDPAWTQGTDTRNGVVSLVTGEVRSIDNLEVAKSSVYYRVDVVSDPLPLNEAHAEIRTDPSISSQNVFRRLRSSLEILANRRGWMILPLDFRGKGVSDSASGR